MKNYGRLINKFRGNKFAETVLVVNSFADKFVLKCALRGKRYEPNN